MRSRTPDHPGDGFELVEDQSGQYRHRSTWLRRWREGDDTACAVTRKAEGVPCGPPVAVVLVRFTSYHLARSGSSVSGRRRAVCPLHLPFAAGAARLSDEAHDAAHARLVQAHADEFARYLDDEVTRRRETATAQAMRKLAKVLNDHPEGTR
ncbi:hypothetical protein ACFLIM_38995 [Nonomuraea sp. M3C6]|uniref:Uncharacterized protein n=1 Tax=Nonomuraea marmarensis TaxID=3351344 RepID=A0ABW7AS09_9ACTN